MSKHKNKHKHGHNGCCGGNNQQHCACSAHAAGHVTKDEADMLRLINVIMEQGKKTSEKNERLYSDMMNDADLTNL